MRKTWETVIISIILNEQWSYTLLQSSFWYLRTFLLVPAVDHTDGEWPHWNKYLLGGRCQRMISAINYYLCWAKAWDQWEKLSQRKNTELEFDKIKGKRRQRGSKRKERSRVNKGLEVEVYVTFSHQFLWITSHHRVLFTLRLILVEPLGCST